MHARSHFTGKLPKFSKMAKHLQKLPKSGQKKEGDHFTFNGTCSTINCQKGMIHSHSKKLLSSVRAHILQVNCLNSNAKFFKNGQKVDQNKLGDCLTLNYKLLKGYD